MKLSTVIPAHNEVGTLGSTLLELHQALAAEGIEHEILVVNDHSTDGTEEILKTLSQEIPEVRYLNNVRAPGFGNAIHFGLNHFTGDAVAVYMADASDRPEDLLKFFHILVTKNVDCVFGSRFIKGAEIVEYPKLKLMLNRCANTFIRILFGFRYNDITNAFKLYRREVIDGVRPILSHHFNLTVELPLKAIVRGFTYEVVPNDWANRRVGESKLKIREMGSRYLFIVLYCFLEKWLTHGDYSLSRSDHQSP